MTFRGVEKYNLAKDLQSPSLWPHNCSSSLPVHIQLVSTTLILWCVSIIIFCPIRHKHSISIVSAVLAVVVVIQHRRSGGDTDRRSPINTAGLTPCVYSEAHRDSVVMTCDVSTFPQLLLYPNVHQLGLKAAWAKQWALCKDTKCVLKHNRNTNRATDSIFWFQNIFNHWNFQIFVSAVVFLKKQIKANSAHIRF